MINIIDEKKMVENLLNNNKLINLDTMVNIRCYIKYLKQEGKSKREIRNKLDEFMMKNYNGFVMADWDRLLNSMVNKYSKQKNCSYKKLNNEIIIYESELKIISEVGDLSGFRDIEIEKVLFIMLVLAKIQGSNWVNYSSEEIFKLARFKYKTKSDIRMVQREKLIYDLANFKNNEILRVSNYGKSPSIELLFIDGGDDREEEIKLNIADIENVIVEYLKWVKKKDYTYCIECGKEINVKSSTHKYCNKCSKSIRSEQVKRDVRNHRLRKCKQSN